MSNGKRTRVLEMNFETVKVGATIHEAAAEIPVAGEFDVVVAGGGPAGVAAALGAARHGAKTKLIESAGCLGGVWTSGFLSWILDSENKTGLMQELRRVLEERGAARVRPKGFAYDPEEMKVLLEELCLARGVDVRLYSPVCAAVVDDDGCVRAAITESKSGREAWRAKVFVDATGDGDLAARAGCGFDMGRPESGEVQPLTLVALVGGVNPEAIRPFIGGGVPSAKQALFEEFQRAGVRPSYSAPTLFHIRDDLYALAANHEYGIHATDAGGISAATLRARAELRGLVRALAGLGDPWRGLSLIATAPQIGVREGRRIRGLYTVTVDDLLEGKLHEDSICRCSFGIDVHVTNSGSGGNYAAENTLRAKEYEIPLRAIIAADRSGLLMAGRCISGDFLAHSSYRVTGNAVALGEAAGTLAALSARAGVQPRDVPWNDFAKAYK